VRAGFGGEWGAGVLGGVGWWEGVFVKTTPSLLCVETKFSSRAYVQNKSMCFLGDPYVMD
jgi:hypothetical protein